MISLVRVEGRSHGSFKSCSSFFFPMFPPGPFCSLLFLLFTSLWYFSVLYLVWFFLDRDTHPAPQVSTKQGPK